MKDRDTGANAASGRRGKQILRPRNTPADIALGRSIRHLRKQAGLTLDEAAVALGVTYQQVQKYETGRNRLSAVMVPVLARLYNQPCAAFFGPPPFPPAPVQGKPDRTAVEVYDRVAALDDPALRRKIARIVAILAP